MTPKQTLRTTMQRTLALSLILIGGSAGVLTLPAPAVAMTVLQVDLKQLVATANVVLHGTIAKTTVLDRRKEGRGVWTEFALDVKETWKGDAGKVGPRFTWRHIGGTTADGMTVAVPGMPTFVAGEEVVVVLEKTSDGFVVSGGPQGKYHVDKDMLGRKSVKRDLHDAHFVRREPAGKGQVLPAPRVVPVVRFLSELRTEVLGYVAAEAKIRATAPPAVATPASVAPVKPSTVGK